MSFPCWVDREWSWIKGEIHSAFISLTHQKDYYKRGLIELGLPLLTVNVRCDRSYSPWQDDKEDLPKGGMDWDWHKTVSFVFEVTDKAPLSRRYFKTVCIQIKEGAKYYVLISSLIFRLKDLLVFDFLDQETLLPWKVIRKVTTNNSQTVSFLK